MSQTTSGVAELISRLKRDGIDAGEAEKQRLLDEAEKKAAAIVAEAKAKAEELLAQAKQERERQKQQLEAELQMAARDFALRFSERIKQQIIEPVVSGPTKAVLEDPAFLRATLQELCVAYAKTGADIELTLSPETRAKLEAFFTGELSRALGERQLSLVDESGLVGFRLAKKGDSFAWDFSLDAVTAELLRLVDPALRRYFTLETQRSQAASKNGQHVANA